MTLRVAAPGGLRVRVTDPAYRGFWHPAPPGAGGRDGAGDAVSLEVRVADPGRRLRGARRVFTAGATWWLGRRGRARLLALDPPALDGGPVWVASWVGRRPARLRLDVSATLVRRDARDRGTLARLLGHPLDQLLLVHLLAARGGLVVHAAGIEVDGRAVLLAGRSGAGKSTAAALLAGAGARRALSDDRVVVRLAGNGPPTAHGTPWSGEAGLARAARLPLAGVAFLARDRGLARLARLAPREALGRWLEVASVPWHDPELRDAALASMDRLLERCPAYELRFPRDGRGLARAVRRVAGGARS